MTLQQRLFEMKRPAPMWYAGRKLMAAAITACEPEQMAVAHRQIADMLMVIPNSTVRDGYLELIRKELNLKVKDMKVAFDSIEAEQKLKRINIVNGSQPEEEEYQLPSAVLHSGGSFDKYAKEIKNYGLFIHLDVIYVIPDKIKEKPYWFEDVSNFSIEIINHMQDEKNPMRLVRICSSNSQGKQLRKVIFDTPYESFLSKMSFLKMVEAFGNFQFFGSDTQYARLKSKLMDEMGDGRMITELGWQDEGFWCFNNCVVKDGEVIDLDIYGGVEVVGVSYYVPSGNSIYKNNAFKFLNQKKASLKRTPHSMDWLMKQGYKVHGEKFPSMMLFAIASAFRDLIFEKCSFFPIAFLYGAASTGKDNLVEFMQSFFGTPQQALVMTGKDNTAKAKIRELAQFKNMPAHFSEYKPDPETDDLVKKLWDGRGYKRGTIDSAFGSEEVPVSCPVIMTGNYYPNDEAVITRLVAVEFFETGFTQEQVDEYDKLKDAVKAGISERLVDILKLRKRFETDFRQRFKEVVAELKADNRTMLMAPRMLQNVAVLGATFRLSEDAMPYPFTYEEWKTLAVDALMKQQGKRESGGPLSHWWDCFIEAVRHKTDPLLQHREFTVSGNELTLNFSQVYGRYTKIHFEQYRQAGMSKHVLMDLLKKSEAFMQTKDSVRFGEQKSSGYQFNMEKLHIREDLLSILSWKDSERSKYGGDLHDGRMAATGENDGQDSNNGDSDKLPF